MPAQRKATPVIRKPRPKATTAEARELELIALAHDVAERQMQEGTASPMVIAHFLRLSTEKAKLELEDLKNEITLKQARVEAMVSTKNVEELYSSALKAMREYQGQEMYDEDL